MQSLVARREKLSKNYVNKRDHDPNLGQVLKLHSGQKIDDPRKNPRPTKKTRGPRTKPMTRDPRQLDYLMENNQFIHL